MEFRKLKEYAPEIGFCSGSIIGGLLAAAADLYATYKIGMIPNTGGAFLGGYVVGGASGALLGNKIKNG